MTSFLEQFTFAGTLAYAIGSPTARYFVDAKSELPDFPKDKDVFFGPAMRSGKGDKKEDVLGTKVLWVDCDDMAQPLSTLPPSMIVFSGHGWHLYYVLRDPLLDIERLESLNKGLIEDVPTSDAACWNCNRVLRIPNTLNTKEPALAVEVKLSHHRPSIVYDLEDFDVVKKLNNKTRHKIRTGDKRGYVSRSERDWAIITSLIGAGATDKLITQIFDHQPCGDKHRENEHYLPKTIENIRKKGVEVGPESDGVDGYLIAAEECYWTVSRKTKKVSTFVLDPKVLLDGSVFDCPDAVVCDVRASGYTWKGKTFSRSAFTSVNKWDREAPVAAWQWLGNDGDIRKLLPHLLEELRSSGLPKIAATAVLGLHKIKGKWFFLGDRQTISAEDLWQEYDGPVCWLPSQREHPELELQPKITKTEIGVLRDLVPKLNQEGTIWPMIGWYSATCLKPWLEEHKYRFPIMNVAGTKGSGKTTLIQRVFMPLFGQTNPKTFDSGTTRFVTLALLGSANAVPIAFSEFRYELVERFIRFILLAYDTGHDPRGRGDQTTVDYPLSAPFTVDGEDLIEDPAARERIIVAQMHPKEVEENSEAYNAFNTLRNKFPKTFGGYYIQKVLAKEAELEKILAAARNAVFEAFPSKMPDRVRNNHIVAYFGILLWCDITGTEVPSAEVLRKSILSVYNIDSGRARTLADAMIEDLVNAVAQGTTYFNSAYERESNILWIQLAPAHSWWLSSRRRSGRGALERDAIKQQLKEAPYMTEPHVVNDAWMLGINLKVANEIGLDIPTVISDRQFVVRF